MAEQRRKIKMVFPVLGANSVTGGTRYTYIDDPSKYFQTTIYSGSASSTLQVTNGGNANLQPDAVWIKQRSSTNSHRFFDTNRGITKNWTVNSAFAETNTATDGYIASVHSDGLNLTDGSSHGNAVKDDGHTYVAWQWKCNGGTTTSNTNGNVTSTVQFNEEAGFSMVSFDLTGTSGTKTVGHGLGKIPNLIIMKAYEDTYDNMIWFSDVPLANNNTKFYFLHTDATQQSSNDILAATMPTKDIFSVVSSFHGTDPQIFYCWYEVPGYSKFGKYLGNGNVDGPMVYTGFKPKYIMIKALTLSGSGKGHYINDSARDRNDVYGNDASLTVNTTLAEFTDSSFNVDFYANGFKIVSAAAQNNNDGTEFSYVAFANKPFVSNSGVPANAANSASDAT